jgi:hypothetical protein
MDEFRVGPISPYDPDRRPDSSGAVKRRREKRAEEREMEADEFVAASQPSPAEAQAGEEPAPDYYEPSSPPEESDYRAEKR